MVVAVVAAAARSTLFSGRMRRQTRTDCSSIVEDQLDRHPKRTNRNGNKGGAKGQAGQGIQGLVFEDLLQPLLYFYYMKTYFNPHLLFSVFIDFTSDRPFLVLLYYPGTVAKKKRGALRPRPRACAAPALANLNSTASKSNNLLLCILL